MEAGVLAEGFRSRAGGGGRQHRRLLVVWIEGCADGAVALYVDLGPERAEVLEEIVDLLLERSYMRRHLLELVAVFERVAAVGSVGALQVEIAAALTWRLAIALDLPPFALITRNADIPVA